MSDRMSPLENTADDMDRRALKIIAVDWSGRLAGVRRTLWLAEAGPGGLVVLRNGWTRESLADHLIAERGRKTPMVVGIDFAFSLPMSYFEAMKVTSAPELWRQLAGGLAEELLRRCEPPFWGKPGKRRPPGSCDGLRLTDREINVGGISPKSVFQIGGAGAVGTGSLRGMPILHRLREAGFAVWPFAPIAEHTIVEIYPRLLTGPVNKSDPDKRANYLDERYPELDPEKRNRAVHSEDAFDAAVSALVMWKHRHAFATLVSPEDPHTQYEGCIWKPTDVGQEPHQRTFPYRIVTTWSDEGQDFVARVPAFSRLRARSLSPHGAARDALTMGLTLLDDLHKSSEPLPSPDLAPLEELLAEARAAGAAGLPDLIEAFRPRFWAYSMVDLPHVLEQLGDSAVDSHLRGIIAGEQLDRASIEELERSTPLISVPRLRFGWDDGES